MLVSVVIPCYNSEATITDVVNHIRQAINFLDSVRAEFVLVNDCSKDRTGITIKNLANKYDDITSINLSHNTGQHNAIMAGFHFVNGDAVLVAEDDGQSPVEAIGAMIKKLNEGYDVVSVRYLEQGKKNWYRQLGTSFNRKSTQWLLDIPKGVTFSINFIALRFVIEEVKRYRGPYSNITGLVYRSTQNLGIVEAVHHDREVGSSGYSLRKLIRLWMNGFTAFSVKPLRISAALGGILSVAGFVFAIVLIIRKLLNYNVQPGWSSVMVLLLLLSGIILILLGLMGEYIGRIYMCINNSPQFVISEVTGGTKKEDE